ncbi:hypothetical protein TPHA_0D01440 [Tetrapisispora phaffii CBS 4417]|uniref:CAP-Gly domain-containing protein n=1 Tax=Tetrapisispora phaffii (strain ATCC 24235 / CBS 4417 / NBRC 1672 / NRRL Y-8282 / UCD 70-5) TaxID=1071381 RepID=G8BSG3_TETPH|nr:hypothetical protein TPHA_0D01440 [Tetrapisispora phaffii CBS 4417]CCE62784.1 hypothetical protein TPHA_0D01440 [Tetrapisispora phaffii CBS 4417]
MVGVGDRVLAPTGGSGIARYIGPTEFADGLWCGIELDDSVGKNDGSVNGVRYFDLSKEGGLYGLFVKVDKIDKIVENVKVHKSEGSTNDVKRLKGVIEKLQDKVLSLQSQLANKETAKFLEWYEDEINHLNLSIEKLSLKETDYLLKISDLIESLDDLKCKYNECIVTLKELETEVDTSRKLDKKRIGELLNDAHIDETNLKDLATRLYNSLTSTTDQYESLLAENEDLLGENTTLQALFEDLNKENIALSKTATDLDKELEIVKDSKELVEFLTNENSKLQNILERKSSKIIDMEKEIEYQNNIISVYAEMEQELHLEIEDLKIKYSKSVKNNEDLVNENVKLSSELKNLFNTNADISDVHKNNNGYTEKEIIYKDKIINKGNYLDKLLEYLLSSKNYRKFIKLFPLLMQIVYDQFLINPLELSESYFLFYKTLLFLLIQVTIVIDGSDELDSSRKKYFLLDGILNIQYWINILYNNSGNLKIEDHSLLILFIKENDSIESNTTLLVDIIYFLSSASVPEFMGSIMFSKNEYGTRSQKVTDIYQICLTIENLITEKRNLLTDDHQYSLKYQDKPLMISDLVNNILSLFHDVIINNDVDNFCNSMLENLIKVSDKFMTLEVISKSIVDGAISDKDDATLELTLPVNLVEQPNLIKLETQLHDIQQENKNLLVKLEVLRNKLILFETNEESLKNLMSQIESLKEEKNTLKLMNEKSNIEITDLQTRLEEEQLNKYFKIKLPGLDSLIKENEKIDRAGLISEIYELEHLVKKFTTPMELKDDSVLSWLDNFEDSINSRKDISNFEPNYHRTLLRNASTLLDSLDSIPLRDIYNDNSIHHYESYISRSSKNFNILKNALEKQFV